jgi:hypothetical protein
MSCPSAIAIAILARTLIAFGESKTISTGGSLVSLGSNAELSLWWTEQGRNNRSRSGDSVRVGGENVAIPLAGAR